MTRPIHCYELPKEQLKYREVTKVCHFPIQISIELKINGESCEHDQLIPLMFE